ncbi:MAG: M20/M25/M40 family metallo-hydrolase [Anaerolineaceae bacterium]
MKKHTGLISIVLVLYLVQLSCSQFQGSTLPSVAEESPLETIQSSPTELETTPAATAFTAAPTVTTVSTVVGTTVAPYGSLARKYLEEIAAKFGSRLTGSDADRMTADYIEGELMEMGYEVKRQPFSLADEDGHSIQSANILAVKTGKSPQEIVVGAHYDSGDEGDGVDDNASGIAVLLETAMRIKDLETPYTVRFIAFGAEETGLNGSSYYLSQLDQKSFENTAYMVNMDSLIAGEIMYVYGDADIEGNLRDWIMADARKNDLEIEGKTADELDPPEDPCECSDYFPFKVANIPYIYFEATNWNLGEMDGWTQVDPDLGDNGMIWHTQYDTIEYIEKIAPDRIDDRLETYVTVLVDALTEYELKN